MLITAPRVSVSRESTAAAVRAFHFAGSPRARAAIYAAELRGRMDAEADEIIRASNTLGTATGVLVTQRALDLLKWEYPALSRLSSDFSEEPVAFGQTVNTRTRAALVAGDYSTSTGYPDTNTVATDVPIVIDQHKSVQVTFNANELGGTRRLLFPENEEGIHAGLADAIFTNLGTKLTKAAIVNETVSALVDFSRPKCIAMKTALNQRKVTGGTRTLLLNSDYYAKLEGDTTIVSGLVNPQAGDAIGTSILPPIAKFQPVEAEWLPTAQNLVGLGLRSDALAVAARPPNDYSRVFPGIESGGRVELVTNPDSGITVALVMYVNHQLGAASMRVALMFGTAIGQAASAQRLVSAATA